VARSTPAGNNGTPASENSFLYDKHFFPLKRSKLVTFGVGKGKVGWSAHRLIKSDARRTWNCAVAVARNFRIRIGLLAGTNAASRAYLATI
jgi:hypothetical protein